MSTDWHRKEKRGIPSFFISANVLTDDIPTSQLANGCSGNSALVYIEKYTGAVLPLTAFDPPKGESVA